MKKYILLIAISLSSLTMVAQDITNTLGSGGKFSVNTPDLTGIVPTSTVNLLRSITYHFRDITGDAFNFEDTDYMVYANHTSTGTLPDPSTSTGRLYMVFRDIKATLTLESPGTIVGNNVLDNPSSLYCYLYSDGINWYVYELSSSGQSGLNPGYVVKIQEVDDTAPFPFTTDVQLYHGKKTGNGTLTVNLPLASNVKGIVYTVTFLEGFTGSGGTLEIIPQGDEKINGNDTGTVQNVLYAFVYSDGDNWWAYGNKGDAAASTQPITLIGDTVLDSEHSEQMFFANFDAPDQTYTATLPAAANYNGKRFILKRNADGVVYSGNVINVKPSVGEQIDGIDSNSAYIMANDYELLTVESNGVIWMITNQINH